MALVLQKAWEQIHYAFIEFSDPRTDNWWLIGTPIPIVTMTILYVLFSLRVGPALMRNRKPFDLRQVIVCYNIFQVLANGFLFVYGIYSSYYQPNYDYWCELLSPPTDSSPHAYRILACGYGYLLLKIADYMDTLFFVLRKQNGHISFLHVYHHALMGLVGYLGARYAPGGNGAVLVLANTFVHTVMYTYYMLSAIDATKNFAAKLKKHITQLQLIQFVCIGSHYMQAYLTESCQFPKILSVSLTLQNTFMSAMFLDFYVRTYWRTKRPVAATPVTAPPAVANGHAKANGVAISADCKPFTSSTSVVSNGNGSAKGAGCS